MGLSQQQQQMVWSIANPQNQPHLNYQQMVVAFRLVSYAQNGIPVSKASLLQNIPVRLPMIVDDDDDDLPPPPVPATTNNAFGVFDSIVEAPAKPSPNRNQRQQQPTESPKHQSHHSPSEMQEFDQMWSRLETFDGMISGETVKSLYRKAASRTSMAKAWRLCCQTMQGYLTKGELFAFLHLIKLSQEGKPLPEELAAEAKSIIKHIDGNNSAELNRSANMVKAKMDKLNASRMDTLRKMR